MHDHFLQYVTTSSAHPHLQEQHIVYTTGTDKRISWPGKRSEYKHDYVQPPAAHSRDHQKWVVTNPVHQYRWESFLAWVPFIHISSWGMHGRVIVLQNDLCSDDACSMSSNRRALHAWELLFRKWYDRARRWAVCTSWASKTDFRTACWILIQSFS